MTAPPRGERGDSQWADYGVNVGHGMYGDVYIYPPHLSAAGPWRRNGAAHRARMTWHVAVRSALTDLARACGRAAAVLAYLRPDEAGKEEE